jgi:hypothetical protein
MTGSAGKYVKALLPCLFFDVGDRQGRHAWADLVLVELGNVLQWVPYIIIMALGSSAPAGAIWGAVGSMTLIIALGVYRHAYAPQLPLLSWLEGGQWVGFLAMGITWEATAFNYNLISPLSTSVLLGTVLASMAAGSPFTQQYARLKVDDETAATKVYLVMNYALTAVWAIVFAAMSHDCLHVGCLPVGERARGRGRPRAGHHPPCRATAARDAGDARHRRAL